MSSHCLDTCQSGHRGQIGWRGGPDAPEQRPVAASDGVVSSCQCVNLVSHTCWCQAVCSDGL